MTASSSTLHVDASPGRLTDTWADPWAYRMALCAALFAIPLVIFGGSVTTLGAGLAVEGWLVAEGHFMLFLPVETWIGDTHRFVEHVHRIFGSVVGLFAVGAAVMAWIKGRRDQNAKLPAALAGAALLAVILQGIIGGQRVVLFSDQLAFLHGALAQLVLAILFASALAQSKSWYDTANQPKGNAPRGFAVAAVLLTSMQIVFGAAYRHALRPDDNPEAGGLLGAHLFVALILFGVLLLFCRKLKVAAASHPLGVHLARQAKRIHILLGLQVLLGFLAWIGYRPGSLGPLEWAMSVAHVLVGGLLLAQIVAAAMWCARLGSREINGAAPATVGGKS